MSGRFAATRGKKIAKQPARLAVADTRAIRREPKVAAPFYLSPEWRALMRQIIAKRGRQCENPACRKTHDERGKAVRIFGDHIVELRDDGAPLDETNIMLLCAACHARKTADARAERAAAVPPVVRS